MTRPLTKVTYCAFERPTYEKELKYQIDYTVFFGAGTSITHTVKVRGSLRSIDKITDENLKQWSESFVQKDIFKEKDYKTISKSLIQIGKELNALSVFMKKSYHFTNGGCYLNNRDSRALKTFEAEIISKAYNHK